MNHTHEIEIPGASLDASIILRQVLASLIAGITTEVQQSNNIQAIDVSVIVMDTGLKFTFVVPSASALIATISADIAMSDVSTNPVQNHVIKAYVDGKFWTGTEAEYEALEEDTGILRFISDTNVIMYDGQSYSLSAHVHGNITNEGAIGAVAGLVLMTGDDGVIETVTVADLKELLGASSGMNFLHNAEFTSPFNTAGLTIYNTAGESLDRWNLLGGTLTINNDYATLSQAAINTAQLRQTLPVGTYDRLLGQSMTLSVLLADDETVYTGTGVIDGVATTIMTFALDNGYLARLVVNNSGRTAYVEIMGGATVGAIDLMRIKLEIGSSSSIVDGVTDVALDWARLKLFALDGTVAAIVTDYLRYTAMTLTGPQQAQARANINAPSVDDVPTTPSDIGAASLVDGIVPPAEARCAVQTKTASFTLAAADAEKLTLLNHATVAIVVTIPADATYDFPIGTAFNFIMSGAAACSFAKEAAVTWKTTGDIYTISALGGPATFIKTGANLWWGTCG